MSILGSDPCPKCGEQHTLFKCPYVKALELDGDKITRVEFLLPIDFPPARPIVPDEEDYPRLGAHNNAPRNQT